jgi:hypothetical protein
MADLDRRAFLTRSSLLAAAAGVAAVVPGALGALTAEAPEVDAAASDASAVGSDDLGAVADTGEPLVAHVRDVSTGEISIFSGTREVVIQNASLARSILRAGG